MGAFRCRLGQHFCPGRPSSLILQQQLIIISLSLCVCDEWLLLCGYILLLPSERIMAVIARIRSAGDRWPTCFSRITWLLFGLALLMDGNVRLVRSQFIFREDPLGNRPRVNSFLTNVVFFLFSWLAERTKFRQHFKQIKE